MVLDSQGKRPRLRLSLPMLFDFSMRRHAEGIVPEAAWGRRLAVGGAPLWLLIRSFAEQELG